MLKSISANEWNKLLGGKGVRVQGVKGAGIMVMFKNEQAIAFAISTNKDTVCYLVP